MDSASGLLDANLNRGCRFVIDLSGYGYTVGGGADYVKNTEWQQVVRDYLRSGSPVILLRPSTKDRMDTQTRNLVSSWPSMKRSAGTPCAFPHSRRSDQRGLVRVVPRGRASRLSLVRGLGRRRTVWL